MGATNGATPAGTTGKPSQDQLADPALLSEAGSFLIKDSNGKEVPFKSLYLDNSTSQKHLIVFIRHFFCGLCEEYIRVLATSLPPSVLSAHNTTLTVIGCGDPVCIPDYKARTNCPYEVYADQKQQLYKKLGMVSNLLSGPEKRPEYYGEKSLMSYVMGSLVTVMKSGSKGLKGGPAGQLGGEWLFEAGELKWCHRMRNVGDHTEVNGLKEVLGIQA